MRTVNMIGGLITALMIFYSFTSCRNESASSTIGNDTNLREEVIQNSTETYYDVLRHKAFNATPEELGLTDLGPDDIYGVIIDYGSKSLTMTVVAYKNGDVSSFFENGAELYGGNNQTIMNSSKHLMVSASQYVNRAKETGTMLSQDTTSVKFYFLTTRGKFYALESTVNFEKNTSQWSDFLKEAIELSSALIDQKFNRVGP